MPVDRVAREVAHVAATDKFHALDLNSPWLHEHHVVTLVVELFSADLDVACEVRDLYALIEGLVVSVAHCFAANLFFEPGRDIEFVSCDIADCIFFGVHGVGRAGGDDDLVAGLPVLDGSGWSDLDGPFAVLVDIHTITCQHPRRSAIIAFQIEGRSAQHQKGLLTCVVVIVHMVVRTVELRTGELDIAVKLDLKSRF